MIAVPSENFNFKVEADRYIETLKFTAGPINVPNKSVEHGEQMAHAVLYEQNVNLAEEPFSPIHSENGMFLLKVDDPKDPSPNPNTIVRQATIPHGNSAVMLGKHSETAGKPTIGSADTRPFGSKPDDRTTNAGYLQRLAVLAAFILAAVVILCGGDRATAADSKMEGPKEEMGKWETIDLPVDLDSKDWMQAVHTALLPNGKVLMVNGSSNRNTLDKDKFIDGVKVSDSAVVSNTALFDPVTNFPKITFERIASPAYDPFCSGHLQLPNGNVLFVGGTNRYYPGEQFEGAKQAYVYEWEKQEWQPAGKLNDGHWYPSIVPLADGKFVVFSGLKYGQIGQLSPSIEIYDPKTGDFHYFDLTKIKNSPFNTKIAYERDGRKIDTYDSVDLYPRIFPTADGRILITGDGAGKSLDPRKSKKSYLMSVKPKAPGNFSVTFEVGPDRKAAAKVYGTALQDPNSDDVLLIGGIIGTGDINFGRPGKGEDKFPPGTGIATSLERWVSPKNSGTKNGRWEIVENFLDEPRAMHQAVILPTKEILVINGGRYAEYKPALKPLLMTRDTRAPGGYALKPMNPATLPRLYHNGALLLPDARVLSIGGNASRAARRVADGRTQVDVLPGGTYYQIAQLTDKSKNPKEFNLKEYYEMMVKKTPDHDHHYYAKGDKEPFVPAEIWQAEIFSPPYLFKGGPRPEFSEFPDLRRYKYGQEDMISVSDATATGSLVLVKLGTVTHSMDYGQRLADLQITKVTRSSSERFADARITFKAPDNAHLYPPGYYMMFYVDDRGVPSHALIVQLGA